MNLRNAFSASSCLSGHSWGVARFSALMIAGAVAGILSIFPAHAEVAERAQQAPGYFRFSLGDLQVTALYDGAVAIDATLLSGASTAEIAQSLEARLLPSDRAVQTSVNAFLIHDADRLVLVDTGTSTVFGDGLGHAVRNLYAAGYDPVDVDVVLLTHLHPDHVSGLLTPDGVVAFPNARVYASETDAQYWLDPAHESAVADELKPLFKLARGAITPYQAREQFTTFSEGEFPLDGVTVYATPGHTPGHVSYLFASGEHRLLVWGDVVHSYAVQLPNPEVAIDFDWNGAMAVDSRTRMLTEAVSGRFWVAAGHHPFPGIGRLRVMGNGFQWIPMDYSSAIPK